MREMTVSSEMRLRSCFIGGNGLRTGWRLLLFVAIFAALQTVFQAATLRCMKIVGLKPVDWLDATDLAIADAVTLLAIVTASALMARIERRSFATYGLPTSNAFGGMFWRGAAFGFVSVTILIGLIALFGGYSHGAVALSGKTLALGVLRWTMAAILIGFAEEFLFRGYLQFTLGDAIGFWPAAALISFGFGALHYFTKPQERWTDWASTGLLALLTCIMLRRTVYMRFEIGMHAAFDFAAIFIYSGPNGGEFARDRLLNASFYGPDWLTGGSLGPEASLLAFPVIAASFAAMHFLYPKARFWVPDERHG